jgi:hypothetical protein
MSPSKLQPALLGGLTIGVLSALPVINIANCCCAWIVFGGAMASYLMQQSHPAPITAGDGAVVGLMAGGIGAAAWALISIPLSMVMGPFQSRIMERVLENARDIPPELRGFIEGMRGADAVGIGLVFGFMAMLFFGIVFGTIGGILGAVIFRKNPPAPPPPPPTPGFTPGSFTPPTFSPPPPPPPSQS